jgi:hypothetical protein
MKHRFVLIGAVATIAIAGGAGLIVYHVCARQAAVQQVDRLLSDLALYVTIRDAIESQRVGELQPIVVSALESDFYRMVLLWQENGAAQADRLQCTIARRVRKMRRDGELFVDERQVSESGIEVGIVDRYLATECLGEPARESWMPGKGA